MSLIEEHVEGWKQGLPPGRVKNQEQMDAMLRKYEVYFSVGGIKWHRVRTPEELAAYDARKAASPSAAGERSEEKK